MRVVRTHAPAGQSRQATETFTGEVWQDPVLPTEDGTTINNVFFVPGARTHWHFHERGQVLQITLGNGLVCTRDGGPRLVEPGDVVWVPAGEEHWHGGTAGCCLQHLAISLGVTTWLDPVTDEEYGVANSTVSARPPIVSPLP